MVFKLRLLFLLSLVLFCFSFIYNEPSPDASLFGKQLVEMIKQNDEKAFIQKFSLSTEEWQEYYNYSKLNPYLSENEKSKITLKNLDYVKSDRNYNLRNNYKRIKLWTIIDSIDVDKIEYLDIDYRLVLDRKYSPNYQLLEAHILIKHKDQLFRIRLFECEYINNKWVYGRIVSITKVDAYLHEIKEAEPPKDYPIEYDTSSVIVNDSLSVFPQSNRTKLSKQDSLKVLKLQNKIDKIYKK